MAKSLQDWTLEEAVTPAIKGTDRGAVITAVDPTRAIHCNVTDAYKITFSSGSTVIMDLKSGTTYPFSVTNINEADGNAMSAEVADTSSGDITLLY